MSVFMAVRMAPSVKEGVERVQGVLSAFAIAAANPRAFQSVARCHC